jgi:hypothetical protein
MSQLIQLRPPSLARKWNAPSPRHRSAMRCKRGRNRCGPSPI